MAGDEEHIVLNPDRLESAARQPYVTAGRLEAYPTLFAKVAAFGYIIAHDHVFGNANKRTASAAMIACLAWNGYPAEPDPYAMTAVMIAIVSGSSSSEGLRRALLFPYGFDPSDSSR